MKRLAFLVLFLAATSGAALAQWAAVLGASRGSAAPSNITVDLWSPMETASPDATTLKAAASGGAVAASAWSTAGVQVTSTSAQNALISTVNSSSTTGTYGYSGHHDTPDYVQIDLNSYPTSQSVLFAYQCTSLSAGTYTAPAAWGEGATSGTAIVRFRVENNAGTYTAFLTNASTSSSAITISAATFYYVTVRIVKNGTCSLAIYNAAGAQVGSTVTLAGENLNFYYHFFGCVNSSSVAGDDYVDNYCIDKTTATFPLGP